MAKKGNRRKGGRSRSRAGSRTRSARRAQMPFGRANYLLILLGLGLVVVGYTIMRIENEMDGFISLYVAPLLILGGYLEIIYAVLYRPKDPAAEAAE